RNPATCPATDSSAARPAVEARLVRAPLASLGTLRTILQPGPLLRVPPLGLPALCWSKVWKVYRANDWPPPPVAHDPRPAHPPPAPRTRYRGAQTRPDPILALPVQSSG